MNDSVFPNPSQPFATAWREIDLSAIASNYRAIRGAIAPTTKIFACLKQDAYGCGAGSVAALLSAEGVDAFGVVSINDALSVLVRSPGITVLAGRTVCQRCHYPCPTDSNGSPPRAR